jgi:hypothetical protein
VNKFLLCGDYRYKKEPEKDETIFFISFSVGSWFVPAALIIFFLAWLILLTSLPFFKEQWLVQGIKMHLQLLRRNILRLRTSLQKVNFLYHFFLLQYFG